MPNANSFPDGRRGRVRPDDVGRVAEYAASALPTRGPGMIGRRFPQGTTGFPLPSRRVQSATVLFPWMPIRSKWQGTGDDPHAGDRKMRFKLCRGKLARRTPENMMDEFLAFGDVGDTDIEEDDAVYTQVYLQVPVSETTVNSGNIDFGKGTIKIIEGADDLADLLDDIPEFGDDGSVPAYIVVPLCDVAWWGGKLHFLPGYTSYLDASISISGVNQDGGLGRDIFVAGTSNNG